MKKTFCLGQNTDSAKCSHTHGAEISDFERQTGQRQEMKSGGKLQCAKNQVACG